MQVGVACSPRRDDRETEIDFISELIHQVEEFVLSASTDLYEFAGWFGVVAMMILENIVFIIPSEIVMPLAGWKLVAERGLGVPMIFVAGFWGAVGTLLGSLLEYWVARAGGRPLVQRYGKWMLLTQADLARADHWFATRGEVTIFLARLVPGVRGIISIPAGVARMNVWRFSFFTFIGALPWTIGLAWAGFALGENYDRIREFITPVEVPVVIAAVLLVAWFIWHRVRQIRREQRAIRAAHSDD